MYSGSLVSWRFFVFSLMISRICGKHFLYFSMVMTLNLWELFLLIMAEKSKRNLRTMMVTTKDHISLKEAARPPSSEKISLSVK